MNHGVPCAKNSGMMQQLGIHIDIARYVNEREGSACHVSIEGCQLQVTLFRDTIRNTFFHALTG